MNDIKLTPGPRLTATLSQEGDDGRRQPVAVDVTARAHEFLFEDVALAEDVTLADIFGLLEADPLLVPVFRRDFSEALLEHARKGATPKYSAGYDPEGIEYLELYRAWQYNTATKTYQAMHRLSLHGIGFELLEDRDMGGYVEKAGTRVTWGVSLTDVRELLLLPLRIRENVVVCEDDFDARAYGQKLDTVKVESVTLGQVIHGVLWELSFHGAPSEQAEVMESLKTRVEEIENGTAELVEGDDIFEEFDRPGIEKLFVTIGAHGVGDVTRALRDLRDDEPTQAGLQERLDATVQVRPEHAQLLARSFRGLFREAKRG